MTAHYLCGIDYQHEMEEGLANFYNTIEELKAAKSCWKQCGILKITLDLSGNELCSEWMSPQNLSGGYSQDSQR